MLDLSRAKRVLIVGGGTAGWLAALEMRHSMPAHVEVTLIESEAIGILGAGEGSILNFDQALTRWGIDRREFIAQTHATYKLGVQFDGWRRPGPGDRYFHMFSTRRAGVCLTEWRRRGFYPYSSWLMSQGISPGDYSSLRALIDRGASQAQVERHLEGNPEDAPAYHFDARRLAAYLRTQAQARGVRRVEGVVSGFTQDRQGLLRAAMTEQGELGADFFIDATGFAGLIHRKLLQEPWDSFADSLLLDRALPFFLPRRSEHPPLVTVSRAMRHGWMWTIPTQDRLGCGYVYSSAFTDEQQVLAELKEVVGAEVEPLAHLRFSPGRLRNCLARNALAVGLSSGFVEPLEATSIGQTIYQLMLFGALVSESDGIIPDRVVEVFNEEVARGWDSIQDFLILHYDGARQDTPFWQAARSAAKPARYLDLRETLKRRTPRHPDLLPYFMGGRLIFGIPSWETVGWAMGHLTRETAQRQLAALSAQDMVQVAKFRRVCAMPG
jgi:tryptophan halogenase